MVYMQPHFRSQLDTDVEHICARAVGQFLNERAQSQCTRQNTLGSGGVSS